MKKWCKVVNGVTVILADSFKNEDGEVISLDTQQGAEYARQHGFAQSEVDDSQFSDALAGVDADSIATMSDRQKSAVLAALVRAAKRCVALAALPFFAFGLCAATVSYPEAKTEPSVVEKGDLTDDSELLDVASTTNAVRETALRARDKDDLAVYTKTTTTVGGKRVVTMTPQADDSLAKTSDLSGFAKTSDLSGYATSGDLATFRAEVNASLPTEDDLKEIAGDALNTIYDEKLKVTWKAVMHDGCLYYVAWTNAVINIK